MEKRYPETELLCWQHFVAEMAKTVPVANTNYLVFGTLRDIVEDNISAHNQSKLQDCLRAFCCHSYHL